MGHPDTPIPGTAYLNLGIVAHSARSGEAKALAKTVHADFISLDDGWLGCDDNHEAVQLHLANMPTEWSVVLEDDALPVEGFRTQLKAALQAAPTPIVSLYLGQKRPPHWQGRIKKALAKAEHACWIQSTHLLHAVGYAIRTPLVPSLLAHQSTLPVDQHITQWARTHNHPIAYTHPSLVDHKDLPTLVDHPDGQARTAGRVAWTVGTRTEWTSHTVTMGNPNALAAMRQRPAQART